MPPTVYIIAGPNGAGKTTFAREYLSRYAHCDEFVNADLIAAGLAPLKPERAAIAAGKLVLLRIRELMAKNVNFGFESTLSGKTNVALIKEMKRKGYEVNLFYLWLKNSTLACQRVTSRVKLGGHDVPVSDIRRRYINGLRNFVLLYKTLADVWILFDNSRKYPHLIAKKEGKVSIVDNRKWNTIQKAG
jgi:predicted ABC-type ATPase